jgi:hypothetical protein
MIFHDAYKDRFAKRTQIRQSFILSDNLFT